MNDIQLLEDLANGARCPEWCDRRFCTEHTSPGEAFHRTVVVQQGDAVTDVAMYSGDRRLSIALTVRQDSINDLSAQDCRDAAAVLLAAADRLEQIKAGS